MIGVVDRFPLAREPDLGLGVSNDESLVITESLKGKFLFIPPPPSDDFDGAMRFTDERGLWDPVPSETVLWDDGGISKM